MFVYGDVTKRFAEVTAVDQVTLEVPTGQMVGVIGPSGAGKSTLLRLTNRLTDPTSGTIRFGETEVSALRGRALRHWRRRCAMIFQQFGLVKRSDALTNVLLGRLDYKSTFATLLGLFTDAERRRALDIMERFGVAQLALQRTDTLSGGQQQRVAIARALMQDPEVILADEPIASLDPKSAEAVMQALRIINQEDGITVLCNLHDVATARLYCDRIIGMQAGRLILDEPAQTVTETVIRELYGMAGLDSETDERAAAVAA